MKVMKIVKAKNLFDKVLFVTVSSIVEVRSIQEKILRVSVLDTIVYSSLNISHNLFDNLKMHFTSTMHKS